MSRINLEDPIIERPLIKGGIRYTITQLPGTANQLLDADMGPYILMVPTAARDITLPAVNAGMRGQTFIVQSGAAFAVTVKNAAAATVMTVASNSQGTLTCLGDINQGIGGWIGA